MEKTINELKNKINTSKKDIDIIDLDEVKIDSSIMIDDELKFIKSAIEKRMNLKIKDIKRIYQATIDGKEPLNFHKKRLFYKYDPKTTDDRVFLRESSNMKNSINTLL